MVKSRQTERQICTTSQTNHTSIYITQHLPSSSLANFMMDGSHTMSSRHGSAITCCRSAVTMDKSTTKTCQIHKYQATGWATSRAKYDYVVYIVVMQHFKSIQTRHVLPKSVTSKLTTGMLYIPSHF